MPSPTRSSRLISLPLRNLTVAYLQDQEAFVGTKAAPFVQVEKSEGKYFTYPAGTWNRLEMKRRGPSQESEGSGYTVSNDNFSCERFAVHKDEDWVDAADADQVFNVDADAAMWLANQGNMHLDSLWSTACFGASIWTTDYTGVSGTPSASQIKQWNVSGSDPQADTETLKDTIFGLIGKRPNLMIVGTSVHKALVTNSIVRTALQYTMPTHSKAINEQLLASFFDVDQYVVARGIYNSAKEGQTATLSKLVTATGMWLGYVNPNPGLKSLSAAYTFAWTGPDGVGSNGVSTRKFQIEAKTTDRYEIEFFVDVKVISADAAAFVTTCVGS